MLRRPNPSSGVPIYLQLMEQVKHAVETGAVRPGEQLPGIRPLAEELVINPNTVAKAYRELEHEGVIELRHGAGAFVSGQARAKKSTDTLRAPVSCSTTPLTKTSSSPAWMAVHEPRAASSIRSPASTRSSEGLPN